MLHMVAKLHYLSELSQVQIAKQLGLSTATISRLLHRARAEGIVQIEVRDLIAPDAMEQMLAERLGLRQVSIVEAPVGALGALAAPLATLLLAENLKPGAIVALGWGRAVKGVLEVGLPPLPGVLIVPMTGGMQQHAPHLQINEFVRIAAEQTGGIPHFIHAPYLPSTEARPIFLADAAISQAVALWDRIDVAIVGIGLAPGLAPREPGIDSPQGPALANAVGEVIRHYFDADGRSLPWTGEDRMITVSPAQCRAARMTIGVASGEKKAASIIAAAKARMISALVTDLRTADAILLKTVP